MNSKQENRLSRKTGGEVKVVRYPLMVLTISKRLFFEFFDDDSGGKQSYTDE
jgi:hypothetical protein